MGLGAKERRIHKVYVTRNTEYHIRKAECVGVRDRKTGRWMRGHLALKSKVSGGLRFHDNGGVVPNEGAPGIGESLFFCAAGRDLITSPVVSVERPKKEIVTSYPAVAA